MKLYHGSPKRLKIIKPFLARGMTKFENQKAIFLCKTFKHAALYAIGKTLKGKVGFGLTPNKLVVVGDEKLRAGYIYEVDVDAREGPRGQFAYFSEIRDFVIKKVYPKDYNENIVYVKDIGELKREVKNESQ